MSWDEDAVVTHTLRNKSYDAESVMLVLDEDSILRIDLDDRTPGGRTQTAIFRDVQEFSLAWEPPHPLASPDRPRPWRVTMEDGRLIEERAPERAPRWFRLSIYDVVTVEVRARSGEVDFDPG